ncbi:MAG: apolipoprotein N-acyltransferase [Deltaproteobacteria bacterium HGW-Deltaproteobacteria-15]|nr:MAG: apolipoprotein N-acyltransferase [Deltaproteobacteria bacterium HGW-Deltaproteobacteria-15]
MRKSSHRPGAGIKFLSCLLSGVGLLFSFAPFNLNFLAFLALIPLLFATRPPCPPKRALLCGMLFGLGLFIPGISWIRYVTLPGWVLLACYCAAYYSLFALFSSRVQRQGKGISGGLALTAAWVILEYVRSTLMTGFPWFLLAHTQHNFTSFIQVADITGTYLISAVVFLVNYLLGEALIVFFERRKILSPGLQWRIFSAVILLSTCCAYGALRIQRMNMSASITVAVAQSNIPQMMKEVFSSAYDPTAVFHQYLTLSRKLRREDRIDLLVWPETIILAPHFLNVAPGVLNEPYSKPSRYAQEQLASLARSLGTYILTGAISRVPASHGYVEEPGIVPESDWKKFYNSAYLLDKEGKYVDRYDKIHLVPFGEYIPWTRIFPFFQQVAQQFVPFTEFLSPGERFTVFSVPSQERNVRFGVLICYEDTDSSIARIFRRNGAEFLVNISNDAWFGTSGELDQHFAAAKFRAIENRVGIVRAGNTGITGLITPSGEVSKLLYVEKNGKKVLKNIADTLVGPVYITKQSSLYVTLGDLPLIVGGLLFLLGWGTRNWPLLVIVGNRTGLR